MTVNIKYKTSTADIIDTTGTGYELRTPSMNIKCISQDKVNGRTLRIFKNLPERHGCSVQPSQCDRTITILLMTPGDEYKNFKQGFEEIVRPETCDAIHYSHPSIYLYCSAAGAHRALETIVRLSSKFFGANINWLDEARRFIDVGANPEKVKLSLDPVLELNIRKAFRNQEGAVNLLEDLKRKNYNPGIRRILERLLQGTYGDISSRKLSDDLKRIECEDLAILRDKGRYEHESPLKLSANL